MTVAEIHQAQASERERIFFRSHGVIVADGERVYVQAISGRFAVQDLGAERGWRAGGWLFIAWA